MDYLHPLPLPNLISRFQPVFNCLNLGLSIHLERLPHSGVSSLIQYLVTNPEITRKLTSRQLIYIHPDNLTTLNTSNLLREILHQSTGENTLITDEYILLTKIKQDKLAKTIILDWSPRWAELPETAKFTLKSLYESLKNNYLIISPPQQNQLLFPYSEKSFNFSLLSNVETTYSVNRFLALYQQKLSLPKIKNIVNKSSGLAGLIKPLIDLSFTQKDILTHPKVQIILSDLAKYKNLLPQKSYLSHLLNIYSPPEIFGNLSFTSPLSHQDILLIKKLQTLPNQIITRDEIGNLIWGKLSNEKYSDWAIDKAISRLRHKLSPKCNSKIITVKNSGYKLISI